MQACPFVEELGYVGVLVTRDETARGVHRRREEVERHDGLLEQPWVEASCLISEHTQEPDGVSPQEQHHQETVHTRGRNAFPQRGPQIPVVILPTDVLGLVDDVFLIVEESEELHGHDERLEGLVQRSVRVAAQGFHVYYPGAPLLHVPTENVGVLLFLDGILVRREVPADSALLHLRLQCRDDCYLWHGSAGSLYTQQRPAENQTQFMLDASCVVPLCERVDAALLCRGMRPKMHLLLNAAPLVLSQGRNARCSPDSSTTQRPVEEAQRTTNKV